MSNASDPDSKQLFAASPLAEADEDEYVLETPFGVPQPAAFPVIFPVAQEAPEPFPPPGSLPSPPPFPSPPAENSTCGSRLDCGLQTSPVDDDSVVLRC
jgi:hypothetical protein